MSDTDDSETYYATLGLTPDATFDQVKTRYKELNDAYLKILEATRKGKTRAAAQRNPGGGVSLQPEQQRTDSGRASSSQETRTEPIVELKDKLAKGKIDKNQFESLARARYQYLMNKSFSELSDSEFEERLKGFEGLKIRLK